MIISIITEQHICKLLEESLTDDEWHRLFSEVVYRCYFGLIVALPYKLLTVKNVKKLILFRGKEKW